MLDPGSSFRPRDHFRWTIDGHIENVSPQGYATIITCGLNRRDLQIARGKVAKRLRKAWARFEAAVGTGNLTGQQEASNEIAAMGARGEEFTSMVRWLIEEWSGLSWEEIEGMPP